MKYYRIKPEVAGGFGEKTKFTIFSGKRRIVHELNYEMDDWLGDGILTTVGCYIVTEKLSDNIRKAALSGVVFDHVTISKSDIFEDLHPDGLDLPAFLWMKVEGVVARDDFGRDADYGLVASEKALLVLQSGGPLLQVDIKPYEE